MRRSGDDDGYAADGMSLPHRVTGASRYVKGAMMSESESPLGVVLGVGVTLAFCWLTAHAIVGFLF